MTANDIPVTVYVSELLNRVEVAEGTMAFHFAKPAGFNFKAGQFTDVTLTDPPETDMEGNILTFSIASPPFENELVFTTRMRNTAFKRSLKKVPLSTEVRISAAAGSFSLHRKTAKHAVFLAGGIGITPFLSIVRQVDHDHLQHKIFLFYSNRRPEDTAFLETPRALEKTNPNFRLICTMTEMSKLTKEWKGETALIDRKMLLRHLNVLNGPIYYIAGPPGMVVAIRQTLIGAGIEEDDIRAEEFSGY